MKLKSLLRESTQWKDIAIEDIIRVYDKVKTDWSAREYRSVLSVIVDFYDGSQGEENQKAIIGYINLLNQVGRKIINLTQEIPYVDIKWVRECLLMQNDFKSTEDDFFPFPVYIAANPDQYGDWMTIGVMIDQHGKITEISEGNDEATPETINMVNKMLNPQGKKVRIYASHKREVVQQIEISEYLPANLYVSPDREYASGYLDMEGVRSLFTGIIDINSVSQESHLDWRTLDKTKIEKFRWLS
jgi:hypothetical protein